MAEPQQSELLSLSNATTCDIVEGLAQAPYRLRQLLDGLYRQRWSGLDQFSTLPLSLREQLASELGYSVGLPAIEQKFTSSDGTVRYLFQFTDGQIVETVWMPEGDGGEAGDGSDSGDEELCRNTVRVCHPSGAKYGLPPVIRAKLERAPDLQSRDCFSSKLET